MNVEDQESELIERTPSNIDIVEYFGEKEIRWYQIASRNATALYLEQGAKRILIEQPTGCGKTLTTACTLSYPRVRRALGMRGTRRLKVLFASHKHRLLTQAEQTFVNSFDVDLMLQSIFSDISEEYIEKGWDIAVLDEAHHESCASFQYHLDKMGEKPIIGLTATPNRADGLVIKFDHIIAPITREQAVEEGFLAPTELNSIVDASKGDKIAITKEMIKHYGHEFGQMFMFFKTKREVAEITKFLRRKKFKAVSILNQNEKEVNQVLDDFSDGKIQIVVNCNKINEGVDTKGCTDVFLGRTYGSYPQLNQVIGRASRPDSKCVVWELIDPLSGRNLDTTVVVGTPERHRLLYKAHNRWNESQFDYVSDRSYATIIDDSGNQHFGG